MKRKYDVFLYPGPKSGYGRRIDKRRGFDRWFVSYQTRNRDGTDPRVEHEWIDAETEEQAREQRDIRYTQLLAAGAKWKGEDRKIKPPKPRKKLLKELDPDFGIHRTTVERTWWEVRLKGKVIGGSYSKQEARKIRNAALRNKEILKPCKHCGKTPVFGKNGKKGNTLAHDEPDCPSYAIIKVRDLSKWTKATLWNRFLRGGEFPEKGELTLSKIEHLL